MSHRHPPHQNHLQSPSFRVWETRPTRFQNPNLVTHSKSITIRSFNHKGLGGASSKNGYGNQYSGVSSENSSEPPPGFEDRRRKQMDLEEGNEITKRKEGIEKIRQEESGKQKMGEGNSQGELKAKKTIHISNLSIGVEEGEVMRCCSILGVVEGIRLFRSFKIPETKFCFVKFKSEEQAQAAVIRLRGTRRLQRFWNVGWAKKDVMTKETEGHKNTDKELGRKGGKEIEGVENVDIVKFMERSWMLVMEKVKSIEQIEETIDKVGLKVLKLSRWGDFGVIAIEKEVNGELKWENHVRELEELFVKVDKMNVDRKVQPRYCWIEVKGIPIQLWSIETMENIAGKRGKLIALDKETDMGQRMDVARLFVETTEMNCLDRAETLKFKDERFNLNIKEIEKSEIVGFMLCQDSFLGGKGSARVIEIENMLENTEKCVKEDPILGGIREAQNRLPEVYMPETSAGKNRKGENNSSNRPITIDNNEDSSTSENRTKVMETPGSRLNQTPRTPIFSESNIEPVRVHTDEPLDAVNKQGTGEENINGTNCSCCNFFRRQKQGSEEDREGRSQWKDKKTCEGKCEKLGVEGKVSNTTEEEEMTETREIREGEYNQKGGRSGNTGKKQTVKRKGRKGVTIGKLSVEIESKSSNKGQLRRSLRKKAMLQTRDSTAESKEVVRNRLNLCDEIGE